MRSPFKIAAPWSPCLSFYVDIAGGGDVGRQPLSCKSRLREFMLALRPFNFCACKLCVGRGQEKGSTKVSPDKVAQSLKVSKRRQKALAGCGVKHTSPIPRYGKIDNFGKYMIPKLTPATN
jgi:hypothetical protein